MNTFEAFALNLATEMLEFLCRRRISRMPTFLAWALLSACRASNSLSSGKVGPALFLF